MLTASLLLATIAANPFPPFKPAMREFRGAWVATVDNIDWPSKKGMPTDAQKKELENIFAVADRVGLNAVVLQIRPSCDALYESELEPWSEFLTGRQGVAPSPHYDPLAYAIELGRAKGIDVHVWFNPYRAKHFKATGPLAENHASILFPRAVKTYGRYLWLDPGEPETPKIALRAVLDVVRRYDIDGVHIDDYFYPYAERDSKGAKIPFPDAASYARYVQSGGTLGRADWRRKNVDDFVESMYRAVKGVKPWVQVGISPFGIARPNLPAGIQAGVDQFDDPLYADCVKWLKKGWCDYFAPQLYWKLDSTGQPYKKLLDWWLTQNPAKRAIWPGNYTGRMFPDNGDWSLAEIENQIRATRKSAPGTGNIHYSFKSLRDNVKSISTALPKGLYAAKAIQPAMPWLGADVPGTPDVRPKPMPNGAELDWHPAPRAERFALYRLERGEWQYLRSTHVTRAVLLAGPDTQAWAVTSLSRTGVESEPCIVSVDR